MFNKLLKSLHETFYNGLKSSDFKVALYIPLLSSFTSVQLSCGQVTTPQNASIDLETGLINSESNQRNSELVKADSALHDAVFKELIQVLETRPEVSIFKNLLTKGMFGQLLGIEENAQLYLLIPSDKAFKAYGAELESIIDPINPQNQINKIVLNSFVVSSTEELIEGRTIQNIQVSQVGEKEFKINQNGTVLATEKFQLSSGTNVFIIDHFIN